MARADFDGDGDQDLAIVPNDAARGLRPGPAAVALLHGSPDPGPPRAPHLTAARGGGGSLSKQGRHTITRVYGQLPLAFEVNNGQLDPRGRLRPSPLRA